MSTILNVYSTNAFKRFLLPAINDADYSILLSKGMFQLEKNVELKLEVVNHEWFFFPTNEYDLRGKNKSTCFGLSLKSVEIARLTVENSESLVILVEETENYFCKQIKNCQTDPSPLAIFNEFVHSFFSMMIHLHDS